MRVLHLVLCCALLLTLSSFSDSKRDKMVAAVDFIGSTFDVAYAPLLWKKQHIGWDLADNLEQVKSRILAHEAISVKEYQKILSYFFHSAKDYHLSIRFHSTESAHLPFGIVGAADRYFVVYTEAGASKLKEGDEVVTFGGAPIHQVVLRLQQDIFGTNDEGTDRSLAEMILTRRIGTAGNDVPHGPIKIGVRRKGQLQITELRLSWTYASEQVACSLRPSSRSIEKEHKLLLERLMLTPYFHDFADDGPSRYGANKYALGHHKGFLPSLGKVLWTLDRNNSFHAYLFEGECNKKIGYIRIPHYVGDEEEVADFKQAIAYLEKHSHALVIDQLNNPGGSVFYLYAILATLIDRPITLPKHRMTLTPREVEFAARALPLLEKIKGDREAKEELGDTLSGYPVTETMAKDLLTFCRETLDEWNAGHFLTKPLCLYGVGRLLPHPRVRYTKPILVLINELDFSGGDFFPAILQDNGRARLMGVKTAGAGGFVATMHFPNMFGIDKFYYTASIAERVDSRPIENLGVQPDIEYILTPADLQGNYRPFVQAIRGAVNTITR